MNKKKQKETSAIWKMTKRIYYISKSWMKSNKISKEEEKKNEVKRHTRGAKCIVFFFAKKIFTHSQQPTIIIFISSDSFIKKKYSQCSFSSFIQLFIFAKSWLFFCFLLLVVTQLSLAAPNHDCYA